MRCLSIKFCGTSSQISRRSGHASGQRSTIISIFAIALWLFGVNTPVFSQESRSTCRAGQVVMVAGQVEAHDGAGNPFPLAAGEWLCANTKLVTGHDGKLVVRLSDKDTNIRLNSDSEIVLRPTAFGGDVSLSSGIMHFLSSVKTQFSVHTRLLSAGIDGTEAIVHVSDADGVLVAVREGLVTTRQGELQLPVSKRGVAYAAPNAAVRLVAAGDVQSLPPVFRSYVVDFDGQVDWAIYYPPALLRAPGTDETAANLLAAGRTSEAEAHLQCAASEIAPSSAPLCLLSAVMRNDGVAANRLLASRQDDSAAWRMAASYAWHLNGQLRAAEQEAEAGLRLDPNNQFAVARLAEILLLRGSARSALQVLPDHKARCGDNAMIAAVTGFALLADHGTRDALKRFDCAIALDQGLPLAHLGRGLALVRLGKLAEGRAELENAASLDPRRASLRTTLGRAYFDEKETDKAAEQFELARDEDPDNGQSYLMTAVERFAANDPIAALQAISAAGARGDTRAAVRDARGLNEDAAVNGTALGRAYSVLGFDQLAVRAGSGAVSRDPGNPGSHRFLAESYQGRSGMDVARTSELLQAELFSGPSKAPIQAQAGEVHLGLLESAGPARVTFREFGPLFDAEGFRLDVSGAIGTDQRAGGEVSASGLHQGFSIAAGQFYFQDDGIGANSDQRELISAARARLAPNSAVSLMGEFSFRDSETGDLTEDLISGISDQRVEQQDRRARLGIKVSPTADIDLYALYTFRDRSVDQAIASADDFLSALDEDGHQVQVRGDFRPRDDLVFVVGGEAGRAKTSTAVSIVLTLPPFFPGFPAPPPIRVSIDDSDTETRQAAGYAYAYWSPTD